MLEIAAHTLRIRCLPKDLPTVIEVDVTPLKVGETIKVGELKPISGVEFLDAKGQPVVSCVEPVAEVVVEAPVAAAARRGRRSGPAAPPPRRWRGSRPGRRQGGRPRGDAKAAAPAAGDKKGAAPAAGAKPAAPAAGAKPAAAARSWTVRAAVLEP